MAECLALADLDASINLMSLSVWNKHSLPDLSPTCMTLELVDHSISRPVRVAEDVFFKVGTFHFPVDFVVIDFDADPRVPLILGRSFFKIGRALIDMFKGELTLRVGKEAKTINLDQTSRYSAIYSDMTANRIDVIDMACEEYSDFFLEEVHAFLALEDDPTSPEVDQSYVDTEGDVILLEAFLNDDPSLSLPNQGNYLPQVRKELKICEAKTDKSFIDEPLEVEFKDLPPHLEYAFLEGDDKLPVIIAKDLSIEEKTALITEDFEPAVQHQRRVNPKIYDVIKNLVLNLLDAGLIYPISDSPWVSPVHCVPKKGGFTLVENEENELILTRLVTGWHVCIDYRKLNEATRKDHFPLPFMDQMLERLARNQYYCFLNGFSGYFQIPIDSKDQDKTIFTCPYRTFAYRCMPFGLCNAPGTFQSKTMTKAESNYTTTENEILAVVYAFEKFRSYLIMNKSIVYTDPSALKDLFAKKDSEAKLLHWVLLLQDFTFKLIDTKGAENLAANHHSRLENPHQNVLDPKEINKSFHLETLNMVSSHNNSSTSWFADFANYHARNFIVKGMLFGTPRAIISDRGMHFCNDQFAKVMLKIGVTHRLATPYHPHTSGQVEVSNRGLKRILERIVGKNRASWLDKLDDALWAFQTAYKTPIGCTPYKLVYGKACHFPIKLEHKAYWALKHANFDLQTAGDHKKVQLNELRDQAYENSLIYKEKTKRLHDSKSSTSREERKMIVLSKRNLFPPLDNPEVTIRRRSRTDLTLLNNSEMAAEGNDDLPSIKVNGVTDDALRLYLFPHSLTHHATSWFDRIPRNSINTFEQMAKMFLGKYFLPSMVNKLRNEISNFLQRLDESLFEAWERYKISIDRCPNHNMLPVTQIDTFYNGLTLRHRDTINVAAGGTFMKRPTVGNTQNVYAAGAYQGNFYQPQSSRNLLSYRSDNYLGPPGFNQNQNRNNQNQNFHNQNRNQGNHHPRGNNQGRNQFFQGSNQGQNQPPAYQAPAYQAPAYQAPAYQALAYQALANDSILKNMQTNMTSLTNSNPELKNMFGQFMKMNTASSSGLETLPCNTITNPKEDLKGITTQSATAYQGPMIPNSSSSLVVECETEATKDTMHPTNNESTKDVQPLVVQTKSLILNSESVVSPIIEPIASPDLNFNNSFADALILMPKFSPSIKSLLTNKDKLCELARTPLNKHCLAVLLKKLPEILGDPGKFLIPCDFPEMAECLALADLDASINLMTLFVWNKRSLLDLSPTCMTLELVDRSISRLVGVAEDVFVKVGTIHFPADFVVVDFDADPRVPLILGRSFFKTERALIDVFEGELTLRVGKEAITFNLDQTSRYSANYSDMTANRIDVIDMACEEYSQEVLSFSNVIASGNPTTYYDPIVSTTSLTLTPFGNSDFFLEEVHAFLALEDDPTSPEVELKDLSPHLEYAFLEGDDKLPVIIVKYLSIEEKTALITILKSHKRAIAWKLSDIKGIDPELFTHKILMEEDFEPAFQHQRRVIPKIYDVIKNEVLKLLDAGLIYPISYSPWVSLVYCVPKKGGFILVENEENELIPTCLVTGWCVCIDNRKNRASWSDKLDDALWAFRTAYKTQTGCTPYKLVYGKACHLPIELTHKAYWALKHANFDLQTTGDLKKVQPNELNELHDQAYENSLIYKEKTKRLHDLKIKDRVFNIGDKVLLFNSRLRIFYGMLKSRWSGPFTISHVFPYGTVELSQPDGPNFKANGHMLKHYFREDVPKMVVPDL
nr:hypothetical protein [Tanacetum cinerariifolium]